VTGFFVFQRTEQAEERNVSYMPTCPNCGKSFSGFSIGSNAASECRECRAARAAKATNTIVQEPRAQNSFWSLIQTIPLVTRTIITVNVMVYVAMGLSGVSWTDPSVVQAIRWGADFGPLSLSGQWWRLFTSMFVHFGFFHIALNMWCLRNLAIALEPMMGRLAFSITYLFSGLAASAVSTAWNPWRASAGASGAIFGIAGAFVSYLVLKKAAIPASLVRQNLRSLAVFILLNLTIGAASGHIDNSAHVGGLAAGLIIGALIPRIPRNAAYFGGQDVVMAAIPGEVDAENSRTTKLIWIAVGCVIALFVGLQQVHARNLSSAQYGNAVSRAASGHTEQAITEMRMLVQMQPNNVLGQALLGEWLLEQNDPAGAVPPLEQALLYEPDAKAISQNLALAYLGAGRPQQTIIEMREAASQNKEQQWRGDFILGLAADELGDTQTALQNLRLAIQLNPNFPEAQLALTRVNAQPGEKPAAGPIPYAQLVIKSGAWPYYP
jgi:membrane associated rhomboid family serine protease/cytochrome c-type biogenesis protein CcmH/NrfG